MIRIAIIGAGYMARIRGKALLETGQAEIVGVASRSAETARAFAGEMGSPAWFDDYRRLVEVKPDAVLIEVPHAMQHPITRWALEQNLSVLIGGALAGSAAEGEEIRALADRKGLVVEAGFQARYQDLYETARGMIADRTLGQIVAVRSIALWGGDPASWYYHQQMSGGMPLTHMTYCFINPVRWLLGADPLCVSAFANRKKHTAPELISEETCIANLLFPDDVLYSITAGFVKAGEMPAWAISIIGTEGTLEMRPADEAPGDMTHFQGDTARQMAFSHTGFIEQFSTFLTALNGENHCRNTPAMTLPDLRTVEAIVESARTKRTVAMEEFCRSPVGSQAS